MFPIDPGYWHDNYYKAVKQISLNSLYRQIQENVEIRKKQTTINGWQKYNERIQQLRQEIREILYGNNQ